MNFSEMSDEQFANDQIHKMEKTSWIRFDCAEDLERQNNIRLFVYSGLTIYLISWSVLELAFADCLKIGFSDLLSVVSIVSSVALLGLSLNEAKADRSVRATLMLQSAHAIHGIVSKAKVACRSEGFTSERFYQLLDEYEGVLSLTGVNHSGKDHARHLVRQSVKDGFPKPLMAASLVLINYYYAIVSMWFQALLLVLVVSGSVAVVYFGNTLGDCRLNF